MVVPAGRGVFLNRDGIGSGPTLFYRRTELPRSTRRCQETRPIAAMARSVSPGSALWPPSGADWDLQVRMVLLYPTSLGHRPRTRLLCLKISAFLTQVGIATAAKILCDSSEIAGRVVRSTHSRASPFLHDGAHPVGCLPSVEEWIPN